MQGIFEASDLNNQLKNCIFMQFLISLKKYGIHTNTSIQETFFKFIFLAG